jgi:hypothetical protein
MEEAEVVLGLRLVAGDQAPEAHEPGEEALDVPSTPVAAEGTAVLGLPPALGMVWSNHLNAHGCQLGIEAVAVVGLVADEAFGQRPDKASLQGFGDVSRFMSFTTRNPQGDRKTVAVRHCHEFGRLAASSDSNKRAPLFAPAWEPSMKASVRSIFPLSRKSSARSRRTFVRTPSLAQR